MQLSELYLNRFLYRDNNQDSGTKDAAFVSGDSSESEPPAIPSGGAAQDINQGSVEINGAVIESGTLPSVELNLSNYGWGQTCVFSSTDTDIVSWILGVFTSASGDTYNISAGNTGNMSAKTFIYFDINFPTEYKSTTTSSTAVGLGKVLIAVAEDAADDATFAMQEATQITGDNIIANTIDASKITTGQLIVGTNVDLGTAFAEADAGDLATLDQVGTAQINTTVISGGKIVTGLLSATNIQTGTLTVDPANSKVEAVVIKKGGDIFLEGDDANPAKIIFRDPDNTSKYWDFYMDEGATAEFLYLLPNGLTYKDLWIGKYDAGGATDALKSRNMLRNVFINTGNTSSGGSRPSIIFENWNAYGNKWSRLAIGNSDTESLVEVGGHFRPDTARTYDCGGSTNTWKNVYTDALQVTRSGSTTRYITMNSSGNLEINTGLYVGGTLSKEAGSFRIDHPLKPDTHYLQHSFVESPDMLNLYRGNGYILDGLCEVSMPDWFTPLNGTKINDYSYQVTSIGKKNNIWVMKEMDNGKVVFAGESDGKFSYLITAIRHDKYAEENRIEIELEK